MIKIGKMPEAQFREFIRGKNVALLCAGEMLYKFMADYEDVIYNPTFILDNFKVGARIRIQKKNIVVTAFAEACEDIRDSIIVLTSEKNADSILPQLDEMELFDGLTIYVPGIFENEYEPFDFKADGEQMIPKKIHYCWFGKSNIPAKFQENIDSWKRCCPEYEIVRWDENNYDVAKCKYMKQAYDCEKWGFVPDYARLDIVYSHGGIYLDVDVEMLKSWDCLLRYPMFCGFQDNSHVAFGLGFGAIREHRIIKSMMDDYEQMEFPAESRAKELIASPIHQTGVLKQYGLIADGNSREYEDFLVLSKNYLAPFDSIGLGNLDTNTLSIHQYAATWFDEEAIKEKQQYIKSLECIKQHMLPV